MPKNKVNSPVFVYNDSHLSLKYQYYFICYVDCYTANDIYLCKVPITWISFFLVYNDSHVSLNPQQQ